MLTHFRDAQSDLSSLPTAGDIFHQQPAHQANAVSAMADLVAQRLLDTLPPDTSPIVALPTDAANAAFQLRDSVLAACEAALLTQMSEMMSLLRTGSSSSHASSQRDNRSSRGRSGRSNGRGRGSTAPAPRAYCWSHGACAHPSSACNHQLPGHQPGATFANMQGGSTTNCFWLPT
jgi:hypothetical protein